MPKGGKRKGSGRKLNGGKYGEQTVPVRIPKSFVDKVKSMIEKWSEDKRKEEK